MTKDKVSKNLQSENPEELKNLEPLGNGYFLADIENDVSSPIKIPNKTNILPNISEEENESTSRTSGLESNKSLEAQNLSERSSSSEYIFRMSEEEVPQNSCETKNFKKANNKNNQK
jgi:hypothetical protein